MPLTPKILFVATDGQSAAVGLVPSGSVSFVSFLSSDQNISWQSSLTYEGCNRQSQDQLFHLILYERRPFDPPVWLSIKGKSTLSSVLWISSQVAVTGMELVLSLTKARAGDKTSRDCWTWKHQNKSWFPLARISCKHLLESKADEKEDASLTEFELCAL